MSTHILQKLVLIVVSRGELPFNTRMKKSKYLVRLKDCTINLSKW